MTDETPTYPEAIADAALRRAAQLQAEAAERIERQSLVRASDNRLDRAELMTIAREAGIASEYLSLALAEVEQQGEQALAPTATYADDTITRWLGTKRRSISVARRITAPAADVLAVLADTFEGPDFRLQYDGHTGEHPLRGGVMRFRMPRLTEVIQTNGAFPQLAYRLEQLEMWTLQVTIHDLDTHSEVVVYGDLRRGVGANVRMAVGLTGTLGSLGLAGMAALCVSSGMGAVAVVPALAAALGSGGATMMGYRASYRAAVGKTVEELEKLLAALQRRIERDALIA